MISEADLQRLGFKAPKRIRSRREKTVLVAVPASGLALASVGALTGALIFRSRGRR
jgi:hypothetical protein